VYKIIEGQKKKNTTKLRLENSCLVDVKESLQQRVEAFVKGRANGIKKDVNITLS
jgi:hypothetical protein